MPTAEHRRLAENAAEPHPWYRWGPYVSERQWGTVREDYSDDGDAWAYFPHDHARSRAYRWGEDGIAGFSDRHGLLNFTIAVWNGRDPILKERLFGLNNTEGNHGEDVKELYFHLDGLPSGAYLKALYRYPLAPYPYTSLLAQNRARGVLEREYELLDTGILDGNAFLDVQVEYAKATAEDILWRITVTNRATAEAPFWLLPQVTARNTWSWGEPGARAELRLEGDRVRLHCDHYGARWLSCDGPCTPLFTENETNNERLFNAPNASRYVKDAFHRLLIDGDMQACNPGNAGSKLALMINGKLAPGQSRTMRLRFRPQEDGNAFADFDAIFAQRLAEADEFYDSVQARVLPEHRQIQRRAFAGLIWSRQFYHLDADRWSRGDSGRAAPPPGHATRNANWEHLHAADVLSMPDKWEYPWFAAWDLAFHMIPYTLIDPQFAKQQLTLLLREWYMHPNGQIPAYEWNFSDVNPPLHAWAAHRVFQIERRLTGQGDYLFLERVFQKLLLNFPWWTNRLDAGDDNVFEGGFLGLDNIGMFDRSKPLPDGMVLEQSDATSWMALYCLNMLGIAIDLSARDAAYEDVCSKFFEHFIYIASAMHRKGLWDEEQGFYGDVINCPDGTSIPVRLRSLVGLLPIVASIVVTSEDLKRLPAFDRRMQWFIRHRPELVADFTWWSHSEERPLQVLSVVDPGRLRRVLARMLDEQEFLAPFGIRALSRSYEHNPFTMQLDGQQYTVRYTPAEAASRVFGGNSNWRGPVWFPANYLLIEALQRHGVVLGEDWKVEYPTGSGRQCSLEEVAHDLSRRLISIFMPDAHGRRPVHDDARYANDPLWRELLLFHEYFHPETGRGVGASHQTGWTAVVAKMIDQLRRT